MLENGNSSSSRGSHWLAVVPVTTMRRATGRKRDLGDTMMFFRLVFLEDLGCA
jgi:hypothetical protein